MDRIEEPGESLTEQCHTRIEDMPNVTFDDTDRPRESLLATDVLLSDYSGIVTQLLHTGRPFIQITDLVDDGDVL